MFSLLWPSSSVGLMVNPCGEAGEPGSLRDSGASQPVSAPPVIVRLGRVPGPWSLVPVPFSSLFLGPNMTLAVDCPSAVLIFAPHGLFDCCRYGYGSYCLTQSNLQHHYLPATAT